MLHHDSKLYLLQVVKLSCPNTSPWFRRRPAQSRYPVSAPNASRRREQWQRPDAENLWHEIDWKKISNMQSVNKRAKSTRITREWSVNNNLPHWILLQRKRKHGYMWTWTTKGNTILLRIDRGIFTTKIFQTVIESRQNRVHILLYIDLICPKWRINFRVLFGTTKANAPDNSREKRLQAFLIRLTHVGMNRGRRRIYRPWMITSMPS